MHPNEPVVLLGGGGHAKVIADILLDAGFEIAGCVCPEGSNEVPETAWLGDDDALERLPERGFKAAHVAVGSNAVRRKLALRARQAGLYLVSAVSPRSAVSRRAEVAEGAAIMPGAVVNTHARIGECAIVNTSASVDHDCRVGGYAHVAPGCHLAGNVAVGEGAFLGAGACAIPGTRIGAWSIVGAGAAVVRDLPDNVTAVGVPARVIKHRIGT